eukprot:Nk52_evm5s2612 gene=Nk52_evmTU5s2612
MDRLVYAESFDPALKEFKKGFWKKRVFLDRAATLGLVKESIKDERSMVVWMRPIGTQLLPIGIERVLENQAILNTCASEFQSLPLGMNFRECIRKKFLDDECMSEACMSFAKKLSPMMLSLGIEEKENYFKWLLSVVTCTELNRHKEGKLKSQAVFASSLFHDFRKDSLKFLFDCGLDVHLKGGCIGHDSFIDTDMPHLNKYYCDVLLVFERVTGIMDMSKAQLLRIYGGGELEGEIVKEWEMMRKCTQPNTTTSTAATDAIGIRNNSNLDEAPSTHDTDQHSVNLVATRKGSTQEQCIVSLKQKLKNQVPDSSINPKAELKRVEASCLTDTPLAAVRRKAAV